MVIKRKLTDEEFRSKLIIVNPNIEPLEAYSGAKNPLLCTCRVCGFTKKYRPDNLIYGNGCQRCGRRERYTTESYREKLAEVNSNIILLSEYTGAAKKVAYKCGKCGHEDEEIATVLINRVARTGCHDQDVQKYSQEEFEEDVKKINPNVKVIGKYHFPGKSVPCSCGVCGYEWSPTAASILKKQAKPVCEVHGKYGHSYHKRYTTASFIKEVVSMNPHIEILGEHTSTGKRISYKCRLCGYTGAVKEAYLLKAYRCPGCQRAHHKNYKEETA